MKTNKRKLLIIITIIVLALIVIGAISWSYIFRTAESSVAGQKAVIEISASELLNAFETNEDSANLKYNNKIISVEGSVAEIQESDVNLSVYLKENDSTSGVMCSFSKDAAKPQEFIKGQKVTIKGICNGYLMDVILNKCALEKP